ncbi:MAG: hypothetical protein WC291_04780, partial [Thermodesulfovibrionales bacterium]
MRQDSAKSSAKGISRSELASFVIVGAVLLLSLRLHLLPALISGLFVYEAVHILAPLLPIRRLSDSRAKLTVLSLLTILIITLLAFGLWGIMLLFRNGADDIPALLHKTSVIIEGARGKLPLWLTAYLPTDSREITAGIMTWLRSHSGELKIMGEEAGRIAAHILIGIVIGGLISVKKLTPPYERRPLAQALAGRAERVSRAFRSVVFAQVRISALNTFFAWLYIGVALPLSGVHLPAQKTMIAITFIAGLLPVIGNLISNTVIIIVSLSHSPVVAVASLVFLVVIHKLEYFLNARIIGTQINAQAWELLMAMLVMEAAFGISGVI